MFILYDRRRKLYIKTWVTYYSIRLSVAGKKCFRYWNTEAPTLVHEVTRARDYWWLYQYDDGCYMYPTNMNTFLKNKN